jgi:antitoxin component HigA of HigAB toxin-antitoxin module
MSDWGRIKSTSEYREAVKEVEKLIANAVKKQAVTIDALVAEVGSLRQELDVLKARSQGA